MGRGFLHEVKMKATTLTIKEKGGSSVALLELGGIQLKGGESVLVDSKIAERVSKIYPGKITVGEEIEVARLKSGHYEKVVAGYIAPGVEVKVEAKVEEKTEDVLEGSKNKSMGSLFGKKKTKTKKKK